ncbi:hypothetical protein KX729_33155 [Rhizobium sp. XQZ8]|uniref:hypothetical protein n=1 Tax=Rhizobium populisoli TaxID=2859785 RepID=UPI001CA57F00|nr:hypothetical protein [Rhizobium populisoli]MBW6426195.1 hypothetical protein [Rhizobium populisoli]
MSAGKVVSIREEAPGKGSLDGRIADAFVTGAIQRREREFVAYSKEPPLQLLTDVDVAQFVKVMEGEAAQIETEIHNVRRRRNAEIAQKMLRLLPSTAQSKLIGLVSRRS